MKNITRLILSTTLVAIALLVAIPLAVAQDQPPTLKPPAIYKTADDTTLKLGDPVTFTIIVANPNTAETAGSTWYNVRVTDDVDPALSIDGASTTRGTVTITGQRVVVNGGIILGPGEQFVITIDCTLVGPVEAGDVLINNAVLEYTDQENNPQPPQEVDEPVEIIIEEEIPPVIPEASTFLLLGSAATGLASYVGLQLRARRRKEG